MGIIYRCDLGIRALGVLLGSDVAHELGGGWNAYVL